MDFFKQFFKKNAHVYFSQIVKLSALLRIFHINCNSNSGTTVHFYKLNFLRMVVFRLHKPWYSTVEIKRGKFSSKRTLICRGKSDFFTQCQPSNRENDTASDVYDYLNETNMIEVSKKSLTLYQMRIFYHSELKTFFRQ